VTKNSKIEFGDFQTPADLARQICELLYRRGIAPAAIVEPTCGVGNLLFSALQTFPATQRVIGIDINLEYVNYVQREITKRGFANTTAAIQADFFGIDWKSTLDELPEPILVIGNPPWVTNSALGILDSTNLPSKTNFQGHTGFEAITGKSNFDISEWMLIHLLERLGRRTAMLAMLCKTSVARKVLKHIWKNGVAIERASIYLIDAKQHFGASVDACLLLCSISGVGSTCLCDVYTGLEADTPATSFGLVNGHLIASIPQYQKWRHLEGESPYQWRSGVKHDCSAVMELRKHGAWYENGLGETVELEDTYLYPLLKSSDIAKEEAPVPRRWLLVTQKYVGEPTRSIAHNAPRTWAYLEQHNTLLNSRKSSVYSNKPPFSIFGVGDYSFAPWKVAISGLYKSLQFNAIGPYQSKLVILDDTCYFVPCQSEEEALFMVHLQNYKNAR
jgi:hypothetical protein